MGFRPNFYLLCVVCLQRLHQVKFQRLQFMGKMRGKTNNVHLVFPSTVYHLCISRMGRVTIQCEDNGIFYRWLHETEKMFEPLLKALFLDPSSLVTSCYWIWWSAVQEYSLHVAPRKHQKRRNMRNGGNHAVSNCHKWTPLCWRQRDPVLTLKGDNFAYFMLNDSQASFDIV
jgi:hypothetical protein